MERRKSRKVKVGNLAIGGDAPITVQSMLNVPASDIENSVAQAVALEAAGCEIIRAAVPDMEAVRLIAALKEAVAAPIESAAAGVDKIRINPGNIGSMERVRAVADACRQRQIPIRIGVNSGSLEKELLAKYGAPTAQALAESAMRHAALLEQCDFEDIVISIKSSDVPTMIDAYRLVAAQCDYPLHLGVTEAGTHRMALIKSAVGIGTLLSEGIGDTIRVSMTDDPVREVAAGADILKAAGLRQAGVTLVSCPTCGRTKIDLIALAGEVERRLQSVRTPLKVAVMGCIVNGPGEAREADIGIAGGDGVALLFKKGEPLYKVPEAEAVDRLMAEIEQMEKQT